MKRELTVYEAPQSAVGNCSVCNGDYKTVLVFQFGNLQSRLCKPCAWLLREVLNDTHLPAPLALMAGVSDRWK